MGLHFRAYAIHGVVIPAREFSRQKLRAWLGCDDGTDEYERAEQRGLWIMIHGEREDMVALGAARPVSVSRDQLNAERLVPPTDEEFARFDDARAALGISGEYGVYLVPEYR